jgi:hypothetical protein
MAEEINKPLTHWEMVTQETGSRRPVIEPIGASIFGTPTDDKSAMNIANMGVNAFNDTREPLTPSRSLLKVSRVETLRKDIFTAPYGEDENEGN